MEKLKGRDRFPEMTLHVAGGGALELPAGLETSLTILLFYRGYW